MHYRVWFSIVLALAVVPSAADADRSAGELDRAAYRR